LNQYFLPVLSFLLSLYFTPLAIKIARHYQMVDKPDGKLKLQKEPVPYLGGLAVFLSFLLSLSLLFNLNREILALLFASTIILFTGFIDDLISISPVSKLMGEILAAWVLIRGGIRIKLIFLPEWASIVLTFLWVLFLSNSLNLVDIMDGLAGTISFFSSLSLGTIAIVYGAQTTAIVGLSMAGAILGFLFFNFPPAKIYLGDTGSLFIGFSLASITMLVDYTKTNLLGFVIPLFFLWIPIFEVIFVSIVRISKGIYPFRGSHDHFPYRLSRIMGNRKRALELISVIHFLLCLWGIIIVSRDVRFTIVSIATLLIVSIIAGFLLSRVKS